jgi:hypothetical protein
MGISAMAVAVASSRRLRPTAETYVDALPVVTHLPPDCQGTRVTVGALHIRRDAGGPSCFPGHVDPEDGVTGCQLAFGPGFEPAQPDARQGAMFAWCGDVTVRADDARGVWVVEDFRHRRLAYVREQLDRPTPLCAARVAGALRPPDAAIVLAALGLVVAVAALRLPRRSSLPGGLDACHDATALPDGTVCLADGRGPLPMPAGARIEGGPVVVVLAAPPESFRGNAVPAVVRVARGTVVEHRVVEQLGRHAFALATTMLSVTPLLVALLEG